MSRPTRLARRTVLRGMGTALALPWLEAMRPRLTFAQSEEFSGPLRVAFLFVPNGIHMSEWKPKSEGADYELPSTLSPLESVRQKLLVLTGLTHDKANANGDGPGDHARSASCFLTASQPFKTDGANIKVGISIDQLIADRIGEQTRFPSLEIGIDQSAQSGGCDSGYSCAYSSNLSWKTPSTPVMKETDPRLLFDRLFGKNEDGGHDSQKSKRRKSVLDFVQEDARSLAQSLGQADRRKLDEYLTSVREVEQRISRLNTAVKPPESLARPAGMPDHYEDHLKVMADLLALAFQSDQTRVSTYMFANEGSNRAYGEIEVPEGHHDLSHHGGEAEKHEKLAKINSFHIRQLAYFLEKLNTFREGDHSILDNSLIVYGSGISDGNAHNHNDLPILLIGGAGGRVDSGRHIRYPDQTPVANLYMTMAGMMGVSLDSFGDSSGPLRQLTV